MLFSLRRRLRRFPILFAAPALILSTAPALGSPWGRQDGAAFISTRADYFRARGNFFVGGPEQEEGRFSRFESNTYAEYGLTPAITLGAKAVYGSSWITNGVETRGGTGFSEIEGFVQTTLWRGRKDIVSLRLTGGAPSRFDTGVRPGLKNDGADLEARALYGRNIAAAPVKIFSAVELGYRRRFGDAADQARLDVMAGFEPSPRLLLLVETFSTLSMRNEAPGGADFDAVKIQPSIVWRAAKRWSVQAGMTHEAAGRGLVLGNTYFVGLWTEF
ncbi:MAG: hypothetical protein ACE5FO_10750 [Parvularculaceae bacterium]